MNETSDPSTLDVHALFRRARDGDQDAWQALFEASYPKIRRAISRRIDTRMRSLFDSSDFANDVWMSLATKPGRFDFENMQALVAFLEQSAKQKLIDQRRKLYAQKRDPERERAAADRTVEEGGVEIASPEPTPSQCVQERETRDRLQAAANSDEGRRVVKLRVSGYSNEDIARETGMHVRKVQRLLQQLQRWWQATSAGRAG